MIDPVIRTATAIAIAERGRSPIAAIIFNKAIEQGGETLDISNLGDRH